MKIPDVETTPILHTIEMTPLARDTDEASASPRAGLAERLRGQTLKLAVFALPSIVFSIYILFMASDVYMSETQFLVRGSSGGNLATTFQGPGFSKASDETQIINSFMHSRDLVDALVETVGLKAIYGRPEADIFSRYPGLPFTENSENLHRHFQSWTKVSVDDDSGITTIQAFAYRPDDAYAIANAMIESAEKLVNRLNSRAYDDRVSYAREIVDKAQADVVAMERRLTEFRNTTRTVDLGKESTATLEGIGKMTTELAMLEANLRQQTSLAPDSPALLGLRERISAYRKEIDMRRRLVVGDDQAMTKDLAQFERLTLERQLVARSLESAVANFDKVRQEAQVQQFYLVRITKPNRIETPEYPRRFFWFAIFLAVSFGLYRTIRAVIELIREHHA
jgi:capsular polysaccharide transport system permease protein